MEAGVVAIITDEPGWHGRQLTAALQGHGLCGRYLSLTDCMLSIDTDPGAIVLPGFENLPVGVFVRGIPGGTLEQVIFRMNVLHALHATGITVYNNPRSIERTVDKPLTSLLLKRAALPTPPTWVCESSAKAHAILKHETGKGNRIVLKPLFGSQGSGVHLLTAATGLIHDEKFAGVYYLQRFIERKNDEYSDFRVLVIDGKAKAAMRRRGTSWLTNRAQGAHCEPIALDNILASLAEAACKILRIDYAGVDLLQDRGGRFQIIEINSIPAWYGLQSVVDFNIATGLIDSFVNRIAENDRCGVCSN